MLGGKSLRQDARLRTGAAEDEAAADDEDVLVAAIEVVEVEVIVWRYVEDPEVTV